MFGTCSAFFFFLNQRGLFSSSHHGLCVVNGIDADVLARKIVIVFSSDLHDNSKRIRRHSLIFLQILLKQLFKIGTYKQFVCQVFETIQSYQVAAAIVYGDLT